MGVDWLSSSRVWVTETPTFNATPADVTAPLGALYILHTTADLDMLARVVVAMAAAGVVAPLAFVTQDRHVRLESSGVFSVTWNSATTLRDLLGFTGDLAAASGYTAPLRSPLLWGPGKTFTPGLAPLFEHGQPVADISATIGRQGRQVVREEGSPTKRQRLAARHVPKDRYYDAPPNPVSGDWVEFWSTEIIGGQKMILLYGVIEGSSNTLTATYGSGMVGPYYVNITNAAMRSAQFARSSGFARVEAYYDISLTMVVTQEYT